MLKSIHSMKMLIFIKLSSSSTSIIYLSILDNINRAELDQIVLNPEEKKQSIIHLYLRLMLKFKSM